MQVSVHNYLALELSKATAVPSGQRGLLALNDGFYELLNGGEYNKLLTKHDTDIFLPRSFVNGSFTEAFNALVTSDGTTITMSLQSKTSGDLTMQLSDGNTLLDCTPAQTITLTAGTTEDPSHNYVYILKSTKALAKSSTGWPMDVEHIKVSYFYVPTAIDVQSDGVMVSQNWNDALHGTGNEMGHMLHMAARSRALGAIYNEGVDPAGITNYITSTTGSVTVQCTSGLILQMHPHNYVAKDTLIGGDNIHVVNDYAQANYETANLYTVVTDAVGGTLNNKFFTFVLWGVANKGGEYSPLMVNMPTGTYNNLSDAQADTSGYTQVRMPEAFIRNSSTGFLVAAITVRQQAGTWVFQSWVDLRGDRPSSVQGGTAIVPPTALTDFPDDIFRIHDNIYDTRKLAFSLDNFATDGITRTYNAPDVSGELAVWTDVSGGQTLMSNNAATGSITVLDTGYIGVGTTSPIAILDAESSSNLPVQSLSVVPSSASAIFGNSGNSVILATGVTNSNLVYLQARQKTGTGNAFDIGINPLGGNVGIGTTSPSYPLDVRGVIPTSGVNQRLYGDINYGALITFMRGGSYQWGAGIGGTLATNGIPNSFFGISEGLATPRFVIAHTTGNVGIGTINPLKRLHVSGGDILLDSGYSIRFHNGGFDYGKILYSSGMLYQGYGGHKFYTYDGAYVEKVRINSSGNVSIGNTNDTYKLDVSGAGRFTGELEVSSITPKIKLNDISGGAADAYIAVDADLFRIGTSSIPMQLQLNLSTNAVSTYGTLEVGNFGTSAGNFITHSGNVLQERTAAEVLGDIGAQPAHGDIYVLNSGDTMTGALDINGGSNEHISVAYNGTDGVVKVYGYGLELSRSTSYIRPTTNNTQILSIGWDSVYEWNKVDIHSDTVTINNNTIWHAGNSNLSSVDWTARGSYAGYFRSNVGADDYNLFSRTSIAAASTLYVQKVDTLSAADTYIARFAYGDADAGGGTKVFALFGDGIELNIGARVNTIETALTNDDTHLPTSGAVYDAIITNNIGGYVLKTGDTMSGNLLFSGVERKITKVDSGSGDQWFNFNVDATSAAAAIQLFRNATGTASAYKFLIHSGSGSYDPKIIMLGTGSIEAKYFISNVATGTQPYATTSTTLNTNLNADLLDGQHGSYYQVAGNYLLDTTDTFTGTLSIDGLVKVEATFPSTAYSQMSPTAVLVKEAWGNNNIYTNITKDSVFVYSTDGFSAASSTLSDGGIVLYDSSVDATLTLSPNSIASTGTNGALNLSGANGVAIQGLASSTSDSILVESSGTIYNRSVSSLQTGMNYWTLNGTDLYYIGGYVGIGTATPNYSLDIVRAVGAGNAISSDGGILIKGNLTSGDYYGLNVTSSDALQGVKLYADGAGNAVIQSYSAGPPADVNLVFKTDSGIQFQDILGAVTMSVDSSGNHNFQSGIATFGNLAGTGDRMVIASGAGALSTLPIPSITINDNADNRIITGSATANTLNAETRLTYTSGILQVNSGGTGYLHLVSEATFVAGQIISAVNSKLDATIISQIYTRARTATTGELYISSSGLADMVIDRSGNVIFEPNTTNVGSEANSSLDFRGSQSWKSSDFITTGGIFGDETMVYLNPTDDGRIYDLPPWKLGRIYFIKNESAFNADINPSNDTIDGSTTDKTIGAGEMWIIHAKSGINWIATQIK